MDHGRWLGDVLRPLEVKTRLETSVDQRTWFGSKVIGGEVMEYDEKGSANNMADDLKFLMAEEINLGTRIKVVGVGGGGSNAVGRMLQEGLSGIEFYILNTDKQALAASPVANKLAVGKKLTSGLGAGADPAVGRQAALGRYRTESSKFWKALPTWFLSRPALAVAPVLGLRLWWLRSRKN